MSPYAKYNLRRNPFGELTRAERAELAVVDAGRWFSALQRRASALQFIGPSGHGKTTHLLALLGRLPEASYVYLPEGGPWPAIPTSRPLLIDEAQRLGHWQRHRVFQLGGPLVLGTHADLTRQLTRHGLRVMTVDVAADQSPERLLRMMNRRIEASRLTGAAVPRLERRHMETLQRELGSNIRAMEQYLYDQFQASLFEGSPWPPAS